MALLADVSCKRDFLKQAEVVTFGAPRGEVMEFLNEHKCEVHTGAKGQRIDGRCKTEEGTYIVLVEFGDDDKVKDTTKYLYEAFR